MKRWLLFSLTFLVIGSAASAELPPVGYIGLYVDDQHEYYCAEGVGFYPVEMWVWCLPSERGMICPEFAIDYPVNVIQSTVTFHPDLGIIIDPPDAEEGISVCYQSCRWDWVWVFHQSLWVTDPTKTYIQIVPHPDIGVYRFANCEPGYPTEPCIKLTNLYLNYGPDDPECIVCIPPDIESVEVVSPCAVVATLDDHHIPIQALFDDPPFEAYRVSDPMDSLLTRVIYTDLEVPEERYRVFTIIFVNEIQPDTAYILRSKSLCGCCGCCESSEMEFTYTGGLPALPDLDVTAVTTINEVTTACEMYEVSVTVQNRGLAPCGASDMQISYEEYTFERDQDYYSVPLHYMSIPPLDIGESHTVVESLSFPGFPVDRFNISATVDTEDLIEELTEPSNRGVTMVTSLCPHIKSIYDRPADEGGWVTMHFWRCWHDYYQTIAHYDILRRVDPGPPAALVESEWEVVAQVDATGDNNYYCDVPTIGDSTAAHGTYWSVYKVRGVRDLGSDVLYYTSCPDSGYSIDNQVATLLRSYESVYEGGGTKITWRLWDIDEGVSFAVHRRSGAHEDFRPVDSPAITRSELTFTFRDVDIEDGGEYRYRIYAVTGDGPRMLLFETDPVMVPARPVTLYQNSPNPFNPSTTIRFYLPERVHVTLGVYDVSGRSVATLIDGYRDRGAHAVEWNGRDARGGDIASGIYFYRLRAGKETVTKKMALLR